MHSKKWIALLLVLIMTIGLLPVTAFARDDTADASTVSANRANVSFVYLGKTTPATTDRIDQTGGYPTNLTAQSIPNGFSLAAGEVVWIGLQFSNMTKAMDLMNSTADDTADPTAGLRSMKASVIYDSRYLRPAGRANRGVTDIAGANKNALAAAWTVVDEDKENPANKYKIDTDGGSAIDAEPRVKTMAAVSEPVKVNTDGENAKSMALLMVPDNLSQYDFRLFMNDAKGAGKPVTDDPVVLMLFPFTLAQGVTWQNIVDANLTTALLQGELCDNFFNMSLGSNGDTARAWDASRTNDNEGNLKNYFNITNADGTAASDGVIKLITPPAPTLGGTVTINGTATYGETLTASVSGGNSGSVGALTYTWKVGGTAVTNSNTDKTTYTLKGADIGKTVTCEVKAADESKATGTIESAATAAVAKRTLTLAGTSVATLGDSDKIWTDDTGAALTKTGIVFNYKADTDAKVTATGMVKNDTIRFTAVSVTYPDATKGSKTLTTTTYTMPAGQQQNDYYEVYTGAITVTGEVKESVLSSIAVTTQPTFSKTQYEIGDTLGWTGMVVTATYTSSKTKEVASYTTDPASGATIAATHNGKALTVSYTEGGVTKTATTTAKISVNIPDELQSISVKTQPKLTYNVGDMLDPSALVITAKWRDQGNKDVSYKASDFTLKINGEVVDADTEMTADMNGKKIAVSYGGKDTETNALTVKAGAVTVTATGTATKEYDNTTEVKNPSFTFSAEGYTVDATNAKYVYTSKNVGTGIEITVTGVKIVGQADADVTVTGATGDITAVKPTITFGNLAQSVGSNVSKVTATAAPASADDEIIVEYEIPTEGTPCDNEEHVNEADHDGTCSYVAPGTKWAEWAEAEAYLKSIDATTDVAVRAYAKAKDEGTSNYLTGVENATTGTLKLTKRTSSGGVPVVVEPNHEAYIIGDDNGMFRPNDGMTRAEAAVILARVSDDFDASYAYTTTLRDVSRHWAANWIGFVASKGIVVGDQGNFRPNDGVTRAEMATMVARFVGLAPNNSAYAFADTNGHWAEGYIAALKVAGIVIGDGNGFRPDAPISRAEAVTMINRALERTPNTAKVNAAVSASPFNDVKRSDWFFAQIIEAAVEHKPADYHG